MIRLLLHSLLDTVRSQIVSILVPASGLAGLARACRVDRGVVQASACQLRSLVARTEGLADTNVVVSA